MSNDFIILRRHSRHFFLGGMVCESVGRMGFLWSGELGAFQLKVFWDMVLCVSDWRCDVRFLRLQRMVRNGCPKETRRKKITLIETKEKGVGLNAFLDEEDKKKSEVRVQVGINKRQCFKVPVAKTYQMSREISAWTLGLEKGMV